MIADIAKVASNDMIIGPSMIRRMTKHCIARPIAAASTGTAINATR